MLWLLLHVIYFLPGYYNNKEETDRTIDKKGWLHTGDIGIIDDQDNVFIVDRIKELIKYKGFQVSSWNDVARVYVITLRQMEMIQEKEQFKEKNQKGIVIRPIK